MSSQVYDVIVVGSGNAGFSAAISAKENGTAKVLILEKAPKAWVGGNTTSTAGAYRTAFSGLDDLLPIVHNVDAELASKIDMPAYTEYDFLDDLRRVTGNRCDTDLADALVRESNETTKWLARNGVRFILSFHRQAYKIGERYKFWGGLVLSVEDGGKGLTHQHQANALRKGIEVRYDSPVVKLCYGEKGDVRGVSVAPIEGKPYDVWANGGVVLCAGGFEADPKMRAEHLGGNWDKAYVRGTPYNTGDLLEVAIEGGAIVTGDWKGCHSTCWDANAPTNAGDQALTNQFTKSGYPLGLMINSEGQRFVDEGIDMRNYTYAKFGREILKQPESICFQVWDADGAEWLRKEEYAPEVVERVYGDSIEDLAEALKPKGLKDVTAFVETLNSYNSAVNAHTQEHPNAEFDPSIKDGLSTRSSKGGLDLDKTNWALPITKAPFLAVKVTCGITFTFGGLKIDPKTAAVVSKLTGQAIPGLFCAGEMVGGLFYDNYVSPSLQTCNIALLMKLKPGGSGLTQGAVFGRKAGRSAALAASKRAAP